MDIKKTLMEVFYGKDTNPHSNVVLEFVWDENIEDQVPEKLKEIETFINNIGVISFDVYPAIHTVNILTCQMKKDKIIEMMNSFGFEVSKILDKDCPQEENPFMREQYIFESVMIEEEEKGYIIVDFDGTLRDIVDRGGKKGPALNSEEVNAYPEIGQRLRQWQNNGWSIFGASNQKGPLRRREYLGDENTTEEENAEQAKHAFEETLKQLGVRFPVFFASDTNVYMYKNGKISKEGTYDKAYKPNPGMWLSIKSRFGDTEGDKIMIGDYEPDDGAFAKQIGAEFVHINDFLDLPLR